MRITLPTTTSSTPVSLSLPVSSTSTIFDVLETLRGDLGLTVSTSDLVGNRSRGERSRSRARSHVSSVFSETGSDTGQAKGDDIQWKVARLTTGETIELNQPVIEVLQDTDAEVLTVEMDESWLLEKVGAGSQPSSNAEPPAGEDEGDTLKASNSASGLVAVSGTGTTSPVPSFHGGTSSSTRLSGLFHGWLDSNQHPAPPPSPQLSIVSGQAAVRTPLNGLALHKALKGEDVNPVLAHARHSRPLSMSGPFSGPSGLKSPTAKASDAIQSPTAMDVIDEDEWEGFLASLI